MTYKENRGGILKRYGAQFDLVEYLHEKGAMHLISPCKKRKKGCNHSEIYHYNGCTVMIYSSVMGGMMTAPEPLTKLIIEVIADNKTKAKKVANELESTL